MNDHALLLNRRRLLAGSVGAALTASSRPDPASAYTFTRGLDDRYVVPAAGWLSAQFGEVFRRRAQGTPYSAELFCAIACQESGYAWWRKSLRGDLPADDVLQLLVLDDGPGRTPAHHITESRMANKARLAPLLPALVAAADATRRAQGGNEMGRLGHLRYGYGLFQYDLDHIDEDAEFWTGTPVKSSVGEPRISPLGLWRDIEVCTDRLVRELDAKMLTARGNLDLAIRHYNGSNANSLKYAETVRHFEKLIRASSATAGH